MKKKLNQIIAMVMTSAVIVCGANIQVFANDLLSYEVVADTAIRDKVENEINDSMNCADLDEFEDIEERISKTEEVSFLSSGNVKYSGTSNNIYWEISNFGDLTVSGSGDWEGEKPPWYDHAQDVIGKVTVNLTGLTNASYMFAQIQAYSYDLSGLNTSEITDMSYMFYYALGTDVDFSDFDTSEVANMSHMFDRFGGHSKYVGFNIDVSDFHTQNVTDMSYMFSGSGAEHIYVNGFDTSNVIDMSFMFGSCDSLESLDISSFTIGSQCSIDYFVGQFCNSLKYLDISSLDFSLYSLYDASTSVTWEDMKSLETIVTPKNVPFRRNNGDRFHLPGVYKSSVGEYFYALPEGRNESICLTKTEEGYHETSNDITWYFYGNGHLEITGSGDWERFQPEYMNKLYQPWYDLVGRINTVSVSSKGTTDLSYMFYGCRYLQSIDFSDFDVGSVVSLSHMFHNASLGPVTSNEKCVISDLNTVNAGDFSYMFYCCHFRGISDLGFLHTDSAVSMKGMFKGAYFNYDSPMDFSKLKTSKVEDMSEMFADIDVINKQWGIDLSKFDTSNVRNMAHMFDGHCSSGSSSRCYIDKLDISSFDVSRVEDFSYMFSNLDIQHIDLSGFQTGSAEDMSYMFAFCRYLTGLDLSGFDTSNVTNMACMFCDCINLTDLNVYGFDTSGVTNMTAMFRSCSFETLDLSEINTKSCPECQEMFLGCSNLKTLYLGKDFKNNFDNEYYEYRQFFNAFYYTNISDIYYGGTEAEWNNLISADYGGGSREALVDTSVHFNQPISCIGEGTNNDIYWQINKYGKLTITGTGNWSSEGNHVAPWLKYSADIKSAVVNLTGTTSASYMFTMCTNLQSVDLANFDMTELTGKEDMFFSCKNLVTVKAPEKMKEDIKISLPDVYRGSDGKIYGFLVAECAGKTLYRSSAGVVVKKDGDKSESAIVEFKDKYLNIAWEDSLFNDGAFKYNNNLAIAGLVLSAAAENSFDMLKRDLFALGFDKIVYDYNYSPAFAIASKRVKVGNDNKTLISVTIRGTDPSSPKDVLTDFGQTYPFKAKAIGQTVKDYINTYYGSTPSEDILFFITGHSLGGATASCLDQVLADSYSSDKLFVYSFAPPKYISSCDKAKNVFEICNCYDIVPYYGGLGTTQAGIVKTFDGSSDIYAPNYRLLTEPSANLPVEVKSFAHHVVEIYMAYLMDHADSVISDIHKATRPCYAIVVRCPVDIEVLSEDNKILCKIVDNVCVESALSVDAECAVVGDEKYIILSTEKNFTIKFVGTDNGHMEYSITRLSDAETTVEESGFKIFEAVALEKDKCFLSTVNIDENTENTMLYVTDSETGKPIRIVNDNGTEEDIISFTVIFDSDGGTAIDDQKVNKDEKAIKPADPQKEGYEFVGWYLGDVLFDFDTPITCDITLKAGWKKTVTDEPDGPNNPDNQDKLDVDWNDILPEDRPADGIIPDALWIAGIDSDGYAYEGNAIKPEIRVYDHNVLLIERKDYSLSYKNNVKVNDASAPATAPTVIVKGKGNYGGTETATFKIIADTSDVPDHERIPIKKTVVSGLTDVPYTGSSIKAAGVSLMYEGNVLMEGKDFSVSYSRNRKVGKATVTFIGKGAYKGILKKTFKITPYDLSGGMIKVDALTGVKYAKGGSKPLPVISFGEVKLRNGIDYTLSYKNNKNLTGSLVVIKGKGNFAGIKEVSFTIEPQNISNVSIVIPDVVHTTKIKSYKPKVKLVDTDGKALKAGADYRKDIKYTYADGTEIGNNIPAIGSELKVMVSAAGSYYAGTAEATYRVVGASIAKARVAVKNPEKQNKNLFDYTGKPIKVEKSNLEVKVGNNILSANDYDIIESTYKNNLNKGKASVQIGGKGNYGGTATVKYNIGTRGFFWWWRG